MTTAHPCPRFEPELSAFIDGETSPALAADIEAHLAACASCRAAVRQLRSVSRVLHSWDAHETRFAVSTGFRNRVFAKIGAAGSVPSSNTYWRVAAAAALVAAGATGFALVAPRLSSRENTDLARLDGQIRDLRGLVDSMRRAPAPSAQTPRPPESLVRVSPLGSVVAEPVAGDAPPAPQPAPEEWEQRGDAKFLREALPDHDDFARDRRALALAEDVLRMKGAPARTESPTAAPAAPTPLATFLGEVHVAAGNFPPFEQVQVWPIEVAGTGPRSGDRPQVLSCEEAISQEVLSVVEGSVRESVVAVNNDPKRAVLVLAGDVLAGGRQDRMAREDVLVAPGQRISIPTLTTGLDKGRTTYRTFTSSNGVAPPDVRAIVAANRPLAGGEFDQAAFDAVVARTIKSLASPGGLGSLNNLFRNPVLTGAADRYVKKFEKRLDGPQVVGFAVSAGSQFLGAEMFGDHAAFLQHRARLLRSYVMAALAPDRLDGAPPPREAVAAFVAAAPKSAFHEQSQASAGTLTVFRGLDTRAFGYGLVDGTRVVHAVFFNGVPAGVEAAAGHGGRRGAAVGPAPLDDGPGPGGAGRGTNEPSGIDPAAPR